MTADRTNRKRINSTVEGRPAHPPSKTSTAKNANAADGDDDKLINLTEAGAIIGITRQAVHKHVLAGTIKKKQIGCRLFVTLAEAKRFKSLERTAGRPKTAEATTPARKRGRPRKEPPADQPPKRPRGRPRKTSQ